MIEVPFLLLVAACVAVAASSAIAIALGVTGRSWKLKYEREAAKPRFERAWKAELISDKKHGLQRCRKDMGQWHWMCECGVAGVSKTSMGETASEENAMKQWLAHVKVHEKYIMPTHELSHAACDKRFVGLWSLFEKYRAACYCQITSNDLILMNQEAKQFDPVKKKEIEDVPKEA